MLPPRFTVTVTLVAFTVTAGNNAPADDHSTCMHVVNALASWHWRRVYSLSIQTASKTSHLQLWYQRHHSVGWLRVRLRARPDPHTSGGRSAYLKMAASMIRPNIQTHMVCANVMGFEGRSWAPTGAPVEGQAGPPGRGHPPSPQ